MAFPDIAASAGDAMMRLVEWQVGFGPRYPGAPGHEELRDALEGRLIASGFPPARQEYEVPLAGSPRPCTNLVCRLGEGKGRPLLLCTHWDSRMIADREERAELRNRPIPGANDGGSGTAVLLALVELLRGVEIGREVQVGFLDAEDVGGLDGNEFSMGARHLARNPVGASPLEVLALDMVGGTDMVLDLDGHAASHRPTWLLTKRIFGIGRELGLRPFSTGKPDQWKHIVSDHFPFLKRGIPAAILIDIDYPEWHTHADLPAAMAPESLAATLRVVATYVSRSAA